MRIILILVILLLVCNVESIKFKKIISKTKTVLKEFAKEAFRTLKNGPTNTPQDWRNEKITSAQHVTRPMEGDILKHLPVDHHGIVLNTDADHTWLLHNTPDSGVVVTDARHMSNNWKIKTDIKINGDKTVSEALRSAGSSSFGKEHCRYIKGGTCIGTANSVEEFLKED